MRRRSLLKDMKIIRPCAQVMSQGATLDACNAIGSMKDSGLDIPCSFMHVGQWFGAFLEYLMDKGVFIRNAHCTMKEGEVHLRAG